jgi:hypothetical protein
MDSVSLQPFTFDEWDAHRQQSAAKVRRSTVRVVVRGADGAPMANATVIVELLRAGFPFGNALTKEILDLPAYEKWFTSRFTVATFENEMKWYSNEWAQNNEDYRVADAMLKLAQKYNIKVSLTSDIDPTVSRHSYTSTCTLLTTSFVYNSSDIFFSQNFFRLDQVFKKKISNIYKIKLVSLNLILNIFL